MIRNFNHRFKDKTVEIFYLGFDGQNEQVICSKTIEDKDRKIFLELYKNLPVGMLNRCHIPHHGFRVFDEDHKAVFECEICYICDSLRFKGAAVHEKHLTFMAASIEAKELLQFYERHLGPHLQLD